MILINVNYIAFQDLRSTSDYQWARCRVSSTTILSSYISYIRGTSTYIANTLRWFIYRQCVSKYSLYILHKSAASRIGYERSMLFNYCEYACRGISISEYRLVTIL